MQTICHVQLEGRLLAAHPQVIDNVTERLMELRILKSFKTKHFPHLFHGLLMDVIQRPLPEPFQTEFMITDLPNKIKKTSDRSIHRPSNSSSLTFLCNILVSNLCIIFDPNLSFSYYISNLSPALCTSVTSGASSL